MSGHADPLQFRRLLVMPAVLLGVVLAAPAPAAERVALVTDLTGAIGPATARHVGEVLATAAERGAAVVVLRMDTPGGLDQSMRDINKAILASPVPVVTFVAPSGARAASAGTYILYASHVAAMAPGTNLGAATPVQIGGGFPLPGREKPRTPDGDGDGEQPEGGGEPAAADGDPMTRKVVNDAAAYIRSLADLRGRNRDWAERAVRDADSLSAGEAHELGVVDLVAADVAALLRAAHGRRVEVNGQMTELDLEGLVVEVVEPGWQNRMLAVLTNPNVAFLLLMIGVYGLVFEFANPGSIGPGVVGVVCLLVAMYALNLLPLDYAGLALVLVGIAFMTAEALTPSFGVLGFGGLVAFVLGASILIDADAPEFQLSWTVIAGAAIASATLLVVVLGFALRAQRRPVTTGPAELLRTPATVLEWQDDSGYVRARGERWRARGASGLEPGAQVTVTAVHGLELEVTTRETQSTGDST